MAGLADLAARRPSLSSLLGRQGGNGLAAPSLPLLKTGEEVTEVMAMSPHFDPRSPSPQQPGSPDYSGQTPTTASAASPTGAASPHITRHFNSLTPGNYSHHQHTPAQSHPAARPHLPSNGGELDEKFLESWSESDDPLSPASFQQIVPGVYLGSAKSAMNVDRLIEHRITHILTVMNRPLNFLAQAGDVRDADILSFTVQRDSSGAATNGNCAPTQVPSAHPLFTGVMHALTTHFVYLLDLPEADLLSALNDCIPYLLHAHLHCRGRVLIHCQAGISRSASVVIAYLVRLYGWSVRQAYEVCYEARPYITSERGLCKPAGVVRTGGGAAAAEGAAEVAGLDAARRLDQGRRREAAVVESVERRGEAAAVAGGGTDIAGQWEEFGAMVEQRRWRRWLSGAGVTPTDSGAYNKLFIRC